MNNKQSVATRSIAQSGKIPINILPFLLLLLLVATALGTAKAQTTFGSVVGVVTDPSGAVIPNAKVTLTSNATGQTHTMTTGSSGTYSFVDIDPATYTEDIEKTGFEHYKAQNIVVQVGSTIRADAALQVGATSSTIEVTTAAPLIQTDSASLGGVIETKTIEDIPLDGRDVNNLLTLVPGVVAGGSTYGNPSTNIIAFGNYQIGGGFGNQSAFYVDGVESNIPFNNSDSIVPSQDDVAEFRVSTNDVSAEFGNFAGGIVNITTKSGSNAFHGTAYEYLRNKVLDANDFFDNREGNKRLPYVQNQYGFTAGGPVVRNKVFYFGGMEREPVRTSNTGYSLLPTQAMVNGDFSAASNGYTFPAIYDTSTGNQFEYNGVLNVIPPGDLTTQNATAMSQLLAIHYPAKANLPTAFAAPYPGGTNYTYTASSAYEQKQYNGRVDVVPGSRDTLFMKYSYWDVESGGSNPYPGIKASQPVPGGFTDNEAVVGNTFTLNPKTILDGRISYLRAYFFTYPTGLGTDLTGVSPGWANVVKQENQNVPATLGWSGTSIAGTGLGSQLYWTANIYSLSGSVTRIVGRHTIKAGAELRQVAWIAGADSNGTTLTYTAQATASPSVSGSGYSFASGLLGVPQTTFVDLVGGSRAFYHAYGFYGTDTYQATRKLTFDLGLRWDQPGSYSEVNNWNTVILPNAANPLGTINNPVTGQSEALKGNLVDVDSTAYPSRREENLHWHLFSPRVGFAYRVLNNTVVRAGYGIAYLPPSLSQDGPNSSSINSFITTVENSYNASNQAVTPLQTTAYNPFPNGLQPPPRNNPAFLSELYGQNIQSRVPNQAYSYVQQWNLTLERQLGSNTSVSAGYAGSKGTHLQMAGSATWSAYNLNQLPDSDLSMGSALLTPVANPFYGIINTGGLLSAPTVPAGMLLKPYPEYGYVTAAGARLGDSTYHSLQASFKQRFHNGGVITAAYTWAKLLSDTDSITAFLDVTNFANFFAGGVQDNNNLRGEKSLSASDTPQNLTVGYGIDLPLGRGQRYLNSTPVNALVSGWRVNGLTTFVAGTPLTIGGLPNSLDTYFGAGGYLQTEDGAGVMRPNVVAGCNRKESGSAVSRVNSGHWFNPACFKEPDDLTFGNESRNDPVLRRQGADNWDFSVAKATHIAEQVNMTFTAEFFNMFNRVQFAPPFEGLNFGPAMGAVTSQANIPRQIQFGLRFSR